MKINRAPVILAIDTSCDDTSVAVTCGRTVLSNVVSSQTDLHRPYGGVFPTVAKQAHRENIQPAITLALKRAHMEWSDIHALAVTQGPGLAPALEVGIEAARNLARDHHLPLLAINHLEGHLLSVLAQAKTRPQPQLKPVTSEPPLIISQPILGLIISGGHSEFMLLKKIGHYQRLGWTIDDAAGECLDKVGRLLNLGYPAGPVIEKFAQQGDSSRFDFPLPMTTSGDYNLSFSGLKTFARNLTEKLQAENQLITRTIYDFAASFQKAVFRHIIYKMNKIIQDQPDLGQVWLGGGVAANAQLRFMIRQTLKKNSHHPSLKLRTPYTKKLCSDNAAMIGVAGYYQFLNQNFVANITVLDRQPQLKLGLNA